jgi:hypothetical protein
MLLKVGFSFRNLFRVFREKNRGIEEFHYFHTLFKIKLSVTGFKNILFMLEYYDFTVLPFQNSKCFKMFRSPVLSVLNEIWKLGKVGKVGEEGREGR